MSEETGNGERLVLMEKTAKSEYEFYMKADVSRYAGEWLAIVGSAIVAHGKTVKETLAEAEKKYPKEKILMAWAPSNETMLF